MNIFATIEVLLDIPYQGLDDVRNGYSIGRATIRTRVPLISRHFTQLNCLQRPHSVCLIV